MKKRQDEEEREEAWPFLVGGDTCLVHSVNDRDFACYIVSSMILI